MCSSTPKVYLIYISGIEKSVPQNRTPVTVGGSVVELLPAMQEAMGQGTTGLGKVELDGFINGLLG